MNQNDFNLNENQSSYTESYTPETPSFDNFDAPPVEDKGKNFADKIKAIFSSKAFFVATVAYTVMAGASVIAGSIDVFAILFTIGMWMVHSVAKRETPLKEIKFLSGVLKAYYIVTIIGIVIMIIAATLFLVFAPNVMTLDAEIDNAIESLLSGNDDPYVNIYMEIGEADLDDFKEMRAEINEYFGITLADFLGIIMIVLAVIFIIAAVVMIIFNELMVHKLSRQFTSTSEALILNNETELRLGGVRACFIILGVLTAISAVSILTSADLILAASEGAYAVAYFALASVLNTDKTLKAPEAPADDKPLL